MTNSPTRPIVGLMLPSIPYNDDGRLEKQRFIDAARCAEAAGFDNLYMGDHLLHPNPLLEPIVTLSLVAAVTERISIGTCVMLIALRDPLWLAKQFGTLATFAPGRLRIGVGVGGEYPGEFEIASVPLATRGRHAEEVLKQLRAIFAGELPPFNDGGVPVQLQPVPKSPMPFLFAGWKEAALKRAATYGDGWIGYLMSPESFAKRQVLLMEERAKLGGAPFTCGMLLPVHIDRQAEGAHARASAAWARITNKPASLFPERLFAAGPAEAIAAQLRRYWDLGCTEIVLGPVDQGAGYLDQVKMLASEVLPLLQAFRRD